LSSNWGPTAQSSNRSPPAPGTEISCAETGRQKAALQLVETDSETRWKRESPDSRAQIARLLAKVQTQRLGGGCTRVRTWDPMIESNLLPRPVVTLKCLLGRKPGEHSPGRRKAILVRGGVTRRCRSLNHPLVQNWYRRHQRS
jgi:hypothetical protein